MTAAASDLELLRRHEPILRFTRGELFLPMPTDGYVGACDLLSGPTIREAKIVAPAGSLTLDGLGAIGDPPPGHLQFLRFVPQPMNAVELARWRNRPGPAALLGSRSPRPGRAAGEARGRRTRHVAPAARARPGRHRRRGRPPVSRDPRARPACLVPRPRHPDRGLDRPPLHVLLRDERLALDVRRRQRPRGGLGAVLHRPRGAQGRDHEAGLVLRRRPRREGRRPPPALGRPAARHAGRPPDRVPGRRLARDLPRARRVHHAAAVPRRAEPARPARPAAPGLAGHAGPARSGRPVGQGPAGAERPVRRLRPRRRHDRRARIGDRVDADRHLRRGSLGRRLPRPVGPRHR